MNRSQFSLWVKRLEEAWVKRDPDMAAGLCALNVKYYEDPFQAPFIGRIAVKKIWEEVPKTQRDIHFSHDVIAIVSQTGTAHWIASYTTISNGLRVELDGIFIVTLDKDGLCTEFHMWWNKKV
ncbi:nuclear transport factor 2 family protein [Candidatus Gottesmanbacteria bacterium]|nr:nuclear transport factor 2 family protein [Candidatus Gottesmanbacteria bacterium]